MLKCHIIDFESADWQTLDSFQDRTVFQTREWIRFISESQKAKPILAEIRDGNQVVGYFSGLVFTKLGVRVLGSSFPGWTTPYIGFNLLPGISRSKALTALEDMAWDSLRCLHLEVSDPEFTVEDGSALGFSCDSYFSYRTDLRKSELEIFNGMESACRRCIRKAEKSGLSIEEAHDSNFANDYYEQLQDVFAKQGLPPTYGLDRVQALIKHLVPTGRILLLRVRDPDNKCIATGIYPGHNKIAEFWGNASFRSSQLLRPNEYIHWYAMRYWKQRGCEVFDWGGGGTYKEKYGCSPHHVPWFIKSRYPFVSKLRQQAKRMFQHKQRFVGWLEQQKSRQQDSPPIV